MAFNAKAFVRLSGGECSTDQDGATINYGYESKVDSVQHQTDTEGYFNEARPNLKYGSLIQLIYSGDGVNPRATKVVYVDSNEPHVSDTTPFTNVEVKDLHTPVPEPFFQTIAEGPLTFTTGGTNSDVVPYALSEVGMFGNFSLNSPVNDIGPPIAHSGIEHVECQAGQIEIFWSRIVTIGQTVNMWFQLRSASPS